MSERHDRVESLIKELAATFVQQEANTDPLITVTMVSTSPDYRRVTIFFTTIPESGQEGALVFLQRNAGEFRRYLKRKSSLKYLPHIEFSIDHGERHRQHMDEVVKNIEEEKKKGGA